MVSEGMIKEIIEFNLSEEYKEKALLIIDETIDKVSDVHGVELDAKSKRMIKNLALDQVNVNISHRANSKTLWVFNIESNLSVLLEREETLPKLGALVPDAEAEGSYKMRPNLTWTFSKANDSDGGVSKESFRQQSLNMLLEDMETAAFYGTLSYVGDVNAY